MEELRRRRLENSDLNQSLGSKQSESYESSSRISRRFPFCRSLRNYRLLVWKITLMKLRSFPSLLIQSIFPILSTLFFIIIRSNQPILEKPSCYLRGGSLPSMGSSSFLTSVFCNWNYTCYEKPQRNHNLDFSLMQDPDLLQFVTDFGKFIRDDKMVKPLLNERIRNLVVNESELYESIPELSDYTKTNLLKSKLKEGDLLFYLLHPACDEERVHSFIRFPKSANITQIAEEICGLTYLERMYLFKNFMSKVTKSVQTSYLAKSASVQTSFFRALPKFKKALNLITKLQFPKNKTGARPFLDLAAGICGTPTGLDNDLGRLFLFAGYYLSNKEARQQLIKKYNYELHKKDTSIKSPALLLEDLDNVSKNKYCVFFEQMQMMPTIGPLLKRLNAYMAGQIVVYPDSPNVRKIINNMVDPTTTLLGMKAWFEYWLDEGQHTTTDYLTDTKKLQSIQKVLKKCIAEKGTYSRLCSDLSDVFNEKPIANSKYGHSLQYIETFTLFSQKMVAILSCVREQKYKFFNDSVKLEHYLSDEGRNSTLTGAIYFDENQSLQLENYVSNVKIRVRSGSIDDTTDFKVLDKWWRPKPRVDNTDDLLYLSSGFVDLQENLERAILRTILQNANISTEIIDDVGVKEMLSPFPCYTEDTLSEMLIMNMPDYITLSWIIITVAVVRSLVHEKESKLKSFLNILGVGKVSNWLAVFTIEILICSIISAALAVLQKEFRILSFSDVKMLFYFNIIFCVSLISQAFFLSVFFDKTNLATNISLTVHVISYLPYMVTNLYKSGVSSDLMRIVCLFPQSAYAHGLKRIIQQEIIGDGFQFDNLWTESMRNDHFSTGSCMQMMLIDAFVFWILTLYLEEVLPSQYSIRKSPCFFCPSLFKSKNNENIFKQSTSLNITQNKNFEQDPIEFEIGILVKNLSKLFDNNVKALNDINLNFYENQITAVLGHNGAGKTTLMSILTGMYSPSYGEAYVLKYNVKNEFENIRRKIGYCPQYNNLFDDLTVKEHLRLVILCRCDCSEDYVNRETNSMLTQLGMLEKANVSVKELSGGQKRKVCVAMAFLGESKVIFLDEPTAGVDPYSRRSIWDLIMSNKEGKTILLTTHHLSEADILANRIAVLNGGKIKAIGSSVFLKSRFGNGVRLIFQRSFMKLTTDEYPGIFDEQTKCKQLLKIIKESYEKAELLDINKARIEILLPSDEENFRSSIINLFTRLREDEETDSIMQDLGITNFAISDSTLEEIFLNLTNEDNHSTDESEPKRDSYLSSSDDWTPYKVSTINFSPLRFFLRQTHALLYKRWFSMIKSYKNVLVVYGCPIVTILISLYVTSFIVNVNFQPSMPLHPWLMTSKLQNHSLNIFTRYSAPDGKDEILKNLYNESKSAYGLTGTRCLPINDIPHMEAKYPCDHSLKKNKWINWQEPTEKQMKLRQEEEMEPCTCNGTGFLECFNVKYDLPHRELPSTDHLHDASFVDLERYLLQTHNDNIGSRYGGFEFNKTENHLYVALAKKVLNPEILGKRLDKVFNGTSIVQSMLSLYHSMLPPTRNVKIVYDNKGYIALPAYLNMYINLLYRSLTRERPTSGIVMNAHPYSALTVLTSLREEEVSMIFGGSFGLIIALSLFTSHVVHFIVSEAVCGSKHLQLLAGMNRIIYWFVNLLWDMGNYSVMILCMMPIFALFNRHETSTTDMSIAFIGLVFCHGLAVVPMMYLICRLYKDPNKSIIHMFLLNIFIGIFFTLFMISFGQQVKAGNVSFKYYEFWNNILQMFPQYCLGHGVINLAIVNKENEVLKSFLDAKLPLPWKKHSPYQAVRSECHFLLIEAFIFIFLVLAVELELQRKWKHYYIMLMRKFNKEYEYMYADVENQKVSKTYVESELINTLHHTYISSKNRKSKSL